MAALRAVEVDTSRCGPSSELPAPPRPAAAPEPHGPSCGGSRRGRAARPAAQTPGAAGELFGTGARPVALQRGPRGGGGAGRGARAQSAPRGQRGGRTPGREGGAGPAPVGRSRGPLPWASSREEPERLYRLKLGRILIKLPSGWLDTVLSLRFCTQFHEELVFKLPQTPPDTIRSICFCACTEHTCSETLSLTKAGICASQCCSPEACRHGTNRAARRRPTWPCSDGGAWHRPPLGARGHVILPSDHMASVTIYRFSAVWSSAWTH
ncbi:translation initiation factor IF-2-like isoform X3 [Canis lupus familiaris]|uniref:translation initiation factor IF-2-like isoform X3 n=1 Tax=Canis lupus familiaris TaxID=9615 RepID=UPI0018F78E0B|nr:translation initiation factor IF-2-like isoform X3 [Canis lupus familiaris]